MTEQPDASTLLSLVAVGKQYPAAHGLVRRLRGKPQLVARAVDEVSLKIRPGQSLGIVGESGSGKTTVARMILGLVTPTSGQVLFEGRDVTRLSGADRRGLTRDIQGVFQDPYSSLNPRHRVEQIIREPLEIHRMGNPAERQRRVRELMDQVALPRRYLHSYPHELSGGLRQRVGIATALAVEPKLIVADEPVSALDVSVQSQILTLLSEIREQTGIAVVFISHDLAAVAEVCDSIAVMCLGRIVETGPTGQIYAQPCHPYTKALLSAVLPTDPGTPYEPIKLVGEPPSPLEPLTGCVFHTRCWQAEPVCAEQTPQPFDFGAGQHASCHVAARCLTVG